MSLSQTQAQKPSRNFLDYLLYMLATTVIGAISFTFLLWLRF